MRSSAKVLSVLGAHLIASSVAGCGAVAFDNPTPGGYDGGEETDGATHDDGGVHPDGSTRRDDAGSPDASPPPPRCGDGILNGLDACDDKNTSNADGCDATCRVEPGWSCAGSPSVCRPICGDGVVAGTEWCDDGNTNDGDTCPATCHHELWSKRYGDGSNQQSIGLAVDTTGDAVIIGSFGGTVDFGGGPLSSVGNDVFIAKLGPAGNHLWSRRAGATKEDDRAMGAAIDSAHNVVVTGVFGGSTGATIDFGGGSLVSLGSWDIFVVKLDAAGNHLWSKRYGDSAQQQSAAVAIDTEGNIVIAGTFWGTLDFGGGPIKSGGQDDIFVAKLDPSGNHLWSKRFGDGQTKQGARSVSVSATGDVYVTGQCAGTVDFGDGPLAKIGEADAFLLALDAAGQHRWSKRWGLGNQYQGGTGVTVDPTGNVLVTGYCQGAIDMGTGVLPANGSFDVCLGKFSPTGAPIFTRRFGSTKNDVPAAIATDASGHILLTGYHEGPIDFGGGPLAHVLASNTFVTKLDANGVHVWSRGYGTNARGLGVGADAQGNTFVAGYFWNSIVFGTTALASAGADDLFLAKIAP